MKRRIIFVMIAVLAVSFASTGSTAPKFLKKAKEKVTGKKEKKAAPVVVNEKKAEPVAKNVVLITGLQIEWCGEVVKDNGSVTMQGLKNADIPVKNGKFDLTLPNAPVFDEEWESGQQSRNADMDFGTAKVLSFQVLFFNNSNKNEKAPGGRGFLPFDVFYSDSDVKGTIRGEPVTLKKGWNIIGDKTELTVGLMCAG